MTLRPDENQSWEFSTEGGFDENGEPKPHCIENSVPQPTADFHVKSCFILKAEQKTLSCQGRLPVDVSASLDVSPRIAIAIAWHRF